MTLHFALSILHFAFWAIALAIILAVLIAILLDTLDTCSSRRKEALTKNPFRPLARVRVRPTSTLTLIPQYP